MAAAPSTALPPWAFPVFFVTGLAAGFVDSIAGGGGLITVPVLFSFSLPPQLALGTNKLQASFGSGSAAWHYAGSKLVSLRECLTGTLFTLAGAVGGTLLVKSLSPDFLRRFVPIVLLAIAAYMIFKPRLGDQDAQHRVNPKLFYPAAGLLLGFYDGFLGPGTGSFWAVAFVVGLGFNLVKATAWTKVMNFASNVASLVVFACAGEVNLPAGLTMGAGQLIGARIGARLVVARGVQFVRPTFLTMVFALVIKLIHDAYAKP